MTTDNIKQGTRQDFAYVESMGSAVRVGYGLTPVDGQEGQYKWREVTLYKKQYPIVTLQTVKNAIIADIDARTVERITSGYEWTVLHGDDTGKTVKVWLSKENQTNFKAKYDRAIAKPYSVTWPMTYKISENDETKAAVYEHFSDIDELEQFVLGGQDYIEAQYSAGWIEKDNIDWTPYEALFPATEQETPAE